MQTTLVRDRVLYAAEQPCRCDPLRVSPRSPRFPGPPTSRRRGAGGGAWGVGGPGSGSAPWWGGGGGPRMGRPPPWGGWGRPGRGQGAPGPAPTQAWRAARAGRGHARRPCQAGRAARAGPGPVPPDRQTGGSLTRLARGGQPGAGGGRAVVPIWGAGWGGWRAVVSIWGLGARWGGWGLGEPDGMTPMS